MIKQSRQGRATKMVRRLKHMIQGELGELGLCSPEKVAMEGQYDCIQLVNRKCR